METTRIKNIFSQTQIFFEISKGQPRGTIRATAPPGGGGYSTNYYTGRLRPKVQPLSLLSTIFHEKGTPFVYCLLLTNGTPFTYLV